MQRRAPVAAPVLAGAVAVGASAGTRPKRIDAIGVPFIQFCE